MTEKMLLWITAFSKCIHVNVKMNEFVFSSSNARADACLHFT